MTRYALLNCEDAEKWNGHTEELYPPLYGEPGAPWDVYDCFDSKFPEFGSLEQYEAVLVTGSHYSAYEDRKWIHELAQWVAEFASKPRETRLFGICFGAQVLAKGLGGKVGPNPSGEFVLTVEDVRVKEGLQQKPYFREAVEALGGNGEQLAVLKLLESHGDQVLELPPGAELFADSATAGAEIWGFRDNILALQGHPELTVEVTLDKIHSALSANGKLSQEQAAASKAALLGRTPDSKLVATIANHFFRHRPGTTGGAESSGAVHESAGALRHQSATSTAHESASTGGSIVDGSGTGVAAPAPNDLPSEDAESLSKEEGLEGVGSFRQEPPPGTALAYSTGAASGEKLSVDGAATPTAPSVLEAMGALAEGLAASSKGEAAEGPQPDGEAAEAESSSAAAGSGATRWQPGAEEPDLDQIEGSSSTGGLGGTASGLGDRSGGASIEGQDGAGSSNSTGGQAGLEAQPTGSSTRGSELSGSTPNSEHRPGPEAAEKGASGPSDEARPESSMPASSALKAPVSMLATRAESPAPEQRGASGGAGGETYGEEAGPSGSQSDREAADAADPSPAAEFSPQTPQRETRVAREMEKALSLDLKYKWVPSPGPSGSRLDSELPVSELPISKQPTSELPVSELPVSMGFSLPEAEGSGSKVAPAPPAEQPMTEARKAMLKDLYKKADILGGAVDRVIAAELAQSTLEFELMTQLNMAANEEYKQIGATLLNVPTAVQELRERQAQMEMEGFVEGLEASVAQLEALVSDLDARSRDLQKQLGGGLVRSIFCPFDC